MIIPDVNLLIYAHNDQAPQHAKARAWWEGLMNGRTPVGLPWITIGGFIRLMTHPRILATPLDVSSTLAYVRAWLSQPPVRIVQPGSRFEQLFLDYLALLGAAGNLTTDAQLAALAVEHQAELHSSDTDFARFDGLRWRNPLKVDS
ncbi:MAG TPA: type II toxin-antitoxin system VapC family toxin [Verrucomicrobiales bacterium]|nr:type II toxin-antitoxin system VapC family toxin [Verrucomicrobiales bacterium]